MRLVNLMSQSLIILPTAGCPPILQIQNAHTSITLAPDSRGPARVVESPSSTRFETIVVEDNDDVEVGTLGHPERIDGLPPPEEGVRFIVSRPVLESPLTADRVDLLCPDQADVTRYADGRVGTERLLRRSSISDVRLTATQRALLDAAFWGEIWTPEYDVRLSMIAARELLGLAVPSLCAWERYFGSRGMAIMHIEKGLARSLNAVERREWEEGNGVAQVEDLRRDWRERLGIAGGSHVTPAQWADVDLTFSEITLREGDEGEAAAWLARSAAARRVQRLLAEVEARGRTP